MRGLEGCPRAAQLVAQSYTSGWARHRTLWLVGLWFAARSSSFAVEAECKGLSTTVSTGAQMSVGAMAPKKGVGHLGQQKAQDHCTYGRSASNVQGLPQPCFSHVRFVEVQTVLLKVAKKCHFETVQKTQRIPAYKRCCVRCLWWTRFPVLLANNVRQALLRCQSRLLTPCGSQGCIGISTYGGGGREARRDRDTGRFGSAACSGKRVVLRGRGPGLNHACNGWSFSLLSIGGLATQAVGVLRAHLAQGTCTIAITVFGIDGIGNHSAFNAPPPLARL
mmetsp:Transcript_80224/g.141944  ORF Transcript_80224/g.141944 Transcript_80224/m.141944 type:complete len:278 (-) Transcript_80224:5-838(-)